MNFNNQSDAAYNHSESSRQGDVAIRIGKIEEARYDVDQPPPDPEKEKPNWTNVDLKGNYRGPLYRIKFGDQESGGKTYWMPQIALRAGGDLEYWAFEVGEQVLVLCVGGDPMQSYVVGSVYQDNYRPPVGIDDKTKDKRAWRETVTRTRFKDDMIVEYDRELHRHTMLFPDGTKYTRWLQDDRVEREKAADSDKTGVPPRHFQKHEWPDGYSYEYMWDEDAKLHYRKEIMADGTIIEFQYNENGEPHKHRFSYSDGGLFEYNLITHTLTIKADKVNISPVTQNQTGVNVSGTLIDSSGNTPHHSH